MLTLDADLSAGGTNPDTGGGIFQQSAVVFDGKLSPTGNDDAGLFEIQQLRRRFQQ